MVPMQVAFRSTRCDLEGDEFLPVPLCGAQVLTVSVRAADCPLSDLLTGLCTDRRMKRNYIRVQATHFRLSFL